MTRECVLLSTPDVRRSRLRQSRLPRMRPMAQRCSHVAPGFFPRFTGRVLRWEGQSFPKSSSNRVLAQSATCFSISTVFVKAKSSAWLANNQIIRRKFQTADRTRRSLEALPYPTRHSVQNFGAESYDWDENGVSWACAIE
jgi:hypothetical protein